MALKSKGPQLGGGSKGIKAIADLRAEILQARTEAAKANAQPLINVQETKKIDRQTKAIKETTVATKFSAQAIQDLSIELKQLSYALGSFTKMSDKIIQVTQALERETQATKLNTQAKEKNIQASVKQASVRQMPTKNLPPIARMLYEKRTPLEDRLFSGQPLPEPGRRPTQAQKVADAQVLIDRAKRLTEQKERQLALEQRMQAATNETLKTAQALERRLLIQERLRERQVATDTNKEALRSTRELVSQTNRQYAKLRQISSELKNQEAAIARSNAKTAKAVRLATQLHQKYGTASQSMRNYLTGGTGQYDTVGKYFGSSGLMRQLSADGTRLSPEFAAMNRAGYSGGRHPVISHITNNKNTRAYRKTGMAFTQLAYALDDVQYGLRGVQNNLQQMLVVMGVSGPIVLAATAAIVYLNHKLRDVDFKGLIDGLKTSITLLKQLELEAAKKAQSEIFEDILNIGAAYEIAQEGWDKFLKDAQKPYPGISNRMEGLIESITRIFGKATLEALNLNKELTITSNIIDHISRKAVLTAKLEDIGKRMEAPAKEFIGHLSKAGYEITQDGLMALYTKARIAVSTPNTSLDSLTTSQPIEAGKIMRRYLTGYQDPDDEEEARLAEALGMGGYEPGIKVKPVKAVYYGGKYRSGNWFTRTILKTFDKDSYTETLSDKDSREWHLNNAFQVFEGKPILGGIKETPGMKPILEEAFDVKNELIKMLDDESVDEPEPAADTGTQLTKYQKLMAAWAHTQALLREMGKSELEIAEALQIALKMGEAVVSNDEERAEVGKAVELNEVRLKRLRKEKIRDDANTKYERAQDILREEGEDESVLIQNEIDHLDELISKEKDVGQIKELNHRKTLAQKRLESALDDEYQADMDEDTEKFDFEQAMDMGEFMLGDPTEWDLLSKELDLAIDKMEDLRIKLGETSEAFREQELIVRGLQKQMADLGKAEEEAVKASNMINIDWGSAIGSTVGDIFQKLGEGGGIVDALSATMSGVGDILQDMGQALITKAGVETAFEALGPAAALIAGIGAVAVGGYLKGKYGGSGGGSGGGFGNARSGYGGSGFSPLSGGNQLGTINFNPVGMDVRISGEDLRIVGSVNADNNGSWIP